MNFVPSASFYVTLMSHASRREFCENQPHHFRNRLPKPIRFVGKGWMVGMVSLSLPTIPVVGEDFVGNAEPVLYVRWHERVYAKDDQGDDVWWHQRREWTVRGQDMKGDMVSSTGSQFFHKLVYRYEQELAKRTQPKNKWTEDSGVKLYPTFEWTSEGDLLLNTSNVDAKRQSARVSWGKSLALKMGWLEEVSTSTYRLGPNVVQEFQGISTIPTPTDVLDANSKPTFWKVDGDYLVLSVTCNWRFVNLNDKFRPSVEFPSTRPMHVYCNVGTSSMVGNRITDLLREIKYHPKETTHFEPRHIQYVPVRNEVVEIVETQMAETNGDLVQFGEGHTILTLHFKRAGDKMSFYVALPSHANRHEFPDDQPNSFKIRLPQPLRLTGGSWQVGLSAISLPDTRVNLLDLVHKNGYIMFTSWQQTYPRQDGKDGELTSRIGTAQTNINDIEELDWVVDGVSFMKATIAHQEQRRKETAIQGGRFTNAKGKHTYVKFRWEGEDLLIDNTNVCHCSNNTPTLSVYTTLAVKMGWIKEVSTGKFQLGPNLQQEFMGDQILDMTKNRDWNDLNDENLKPVFWIVRSFLPDHLHSSMSCCWRFTNFNVAFRAVVGDPSRSLQVYLDVAGSSIVGNRVNDLLREIQYKQEGRGTLYFEPLHIQYLPLRNEVVEIIQIQVAETFGTGGDLVKFGKGHTIVTLHFKKT